MKVNRTPLSKMAYVFEPFKGTDDSVDGIYTSVLKSHGYNVLRYENQQALTNPQYENQVYVAQALTALVQGSGFFLVASHGITQGGFVVEVYNDTMSFYDRWLLYGGVYYNVPNQPDYVSWTGGTKRGWWGIAVTDEAIAHHFSSARTVVLNWVCVGSTWRAAWVNAAAILDWPNEKCYSNTLVVDGIFEGLDGQLGPNKRRLYSAYEAEGNAHLQFTGDRNMVLSPIVLEVNRPGIAGIL